MARIRSIHPGLASDEMYMSMTMAAKAAWPVIWTECDDHGVFEWKSIVLKARIFPADNVDFESILREWVDLGCIRKETIDGKPYGFIRNFCRYQRVKNPSYRHAIPVALRVFIGLKSDVEDKAPTVLPQPYPLPTEIPPLREEVGGRREEEEEAAPQPPAPPREDGKPSERFDRIEKACREALGAQAPVDPVIGPIVLLTEKGVKLSEIVTVLRSESRRPRASPIRSWGLWSKLIVERLDGAPKIAPRRVDDPADPRILFDGGVSWPTSSVKRAVESWQRDPSSWPVEVLGWPPGSPGCRVPKHLLPAGLPLSPNQDTDHHSSDRSVA